MAECLTVDQDVAGSTPVAHPSRFGESLIVWSGSFL